MCVYSRVTWTTVRLLNTWRWTVRWAVLWNVKTLPMMMERQPGTGCMVGVQARVEGNVADDHGTTLDGKPDAAVIGQRLSLW